MGGGVEALVPLELLDSISDHKHACVAQLAHKLLSLRVEVIVLFLLLVAPSYEPVNLGVRFDLQISDLCALLNRFCPETAGFIIRDAVCLLVEKFDIEPFPDFSAK